MVLRFRKWREVLILFVPVVYVIGLYGPQLFANHNLLVVSRVFRELLLGFRDN